MKRKFNFERVFGFIIAQRMWFVKHQKPDVAWLHHIDKKGIKSTLGSSLSSTTWWITGFKLNNAPVLFYPSDTCWVDGTWSTRLSMRFGGLPKTCPCGCPSLVQLVAHQFCRFLVGQLEVAAKMCVPTSSPPLAHRFALRLCTPLNTKIFTQLKRLYALCNFDIKNLLY